MNLSFINKVALVTGGTSGIGRATALALAKAGAKVVVSGRREKEGNAVVAEIKAAGGEATFVQADVAREADVQALVAKTLATYGRLDVAFNNAGIDVLTPLTEATEADYRRVFDINVWGVVASMKHEIPAMLRTRGGAIVNTSSVAGHIGMAGVSLYVGTKHAVEGITKSAALEFAKQGIRVNAVAPAAIETDMIDRFVGKEGDQRNYLASLHPIGRMGRSEEIADVVLFLCSEHASFITGESLKIDGGWTAQ
jgi:NAD(P)-dependent dehydrogenase (short-subunit alcohol dehydrogenase family)